MHSFVWWSTFIVVIVAAVIDICKRRIPNLLSLPFLMAGIVVNTHDKGLAGIEQSVGGIALAIGVLGILCYLRGMGLGDLKLCAAVGAWIGPEQLLIALVAMGFAGGILAAGYALWHGSLASAVDNTAELILELPKQGFRPHKAISLNNVSALKMPYAPAIALGTIFSFFAM